MLLTIIPDVPVSARFGRSFLYVQCAFRSFGSESAARRDCAGRGCDSIGTNPNLFTLVDNLDTTIPQDFYIPVTVVVPQNANYLVVGVLDSAYADNSSSGLAVSI